MSTARPKYGPRDTVYLRESAAAGFIESITISSVQHGMSGWSYAVSVLGNNHNQVYGERRNMTNNAIMTFDECEFIDYCDALLLAREYHTRSLLIIESRIANSCDIT